MMKSVQILIVIACLLAAACQKRKYQPDLVKLGDEEIYCSGDFGGKPITLKIGTDGYYCYASYQQRPDSFYVFEGELRKYECNPCVEALRVELADYKQRLPGASVEVDSSLRAGNRHFIPGVSKPVTLQFMSRSNKAVSYVRWNINNGPSLPDSNMRFEFTQPGVQTVSLTVRTNGGCESMITNKIFIGENGVFASEIVAGSPQNNSAQFSPMITGGKPPYKYTWNFGDGSTSDLPSPTHNYQYAGSYPVKLQIQDADNHICESNLIYVTANDWSSCSVNMSVSYAGSRNVLPNGVKVQWKDKSNVTFRSDSVAQPADSYFDVVKSEPYEPNERGEAGRLLTIRFNVLLSDGTRKVWFKSESTAIAVTYK
jgi:PKD repeat protein